MSVYNLLCYFRCGELKYRKRIVFSPIFTLGTFHFWRDHCSGKDWGQGLSRLGLGTWPPTPTHPPGGGGGENGFIARVFPSQICRNYFTRGLFLPSQVRALGLGLVSRIEHCFLRETHPVGIWIISSSRIVCYYSWLIDDNKDERESYLLQ